MSIHIQVPVGLPGHGPLLEGQVLGNHEAFKVATLEQVTRTADGGLKPWIALDLYGLMALL